MRSVLICFADWLLLNLWLNHPAGGEFNKSVLRIRSTYRNWRLPFVSRLRREHDVNSRLALPAALDIVNQSAFAASVLSSEVPISVNWAG
jgi:hypothetical protein